MSKVSAADVLKASERISSFIHKTPIVTSTQANNKCGRQLFFKCENFQKSGSFKARGAMNAVLKAKDENPNINGLITHSSGNHGQALAWAAQQAKIPCSVVIPQVAPEIKKDAIRNYGAEVIECGDKPSDRSDVMKKIQEERNLTFIPPYDHYDVIAGQGTIGLEFLEQVPQLDALLITISGGGMSSGMALAAKSIKPDIKIFLVCPKGKRLQETLESGKRVWEGPPQYLNTIADGIRLQQTGLLTTPILMDLAEKEVFEMSEPEIIEAMKFSFERMKLVVEAAAACGIAAAFSDKLKQMDNSLKNIGVILCGGNLDLENLPF